MDSLAIFCFFSNIGHPGGLFQLIADNEYSIIFLIAHFLVVLFIFLSHDVDWSFNGPGRNHILARKDRCEEDTLRKLERENPYNNIHDYIAIEEDLGLRSTFFFRTNYENGRLIEHEDDIQALLNGGREVGLHCNPFSVDNFDSMRQEKKGLESITKKTVKANRSHHLAFSERLPSISELSHLCEY